MVYIFIGFFFSFTYVYYYCIFAAFFGNSVIDRSTVTEDTKLLIIPRPDIKFVGSGRIRKVEFYLSNYGSNTDKIYFYLLETNYVPRTDDNHYKAVKQQLCTATVVGFNECILTDFNFHVDEVIGMSFVKHSGLNYDKTSCVNQGNDKPKRSSLKMSAPPSVLWTETRFNVLSECRTYSIQFDLIFD